MVRLGGEISNQLFEIPEHWNTISKTSDSHFEPNAQNIVRRSAELFRADEAITRTASSAGVLNENAPVNEITDIP